MVGESRAQSAVAEIPLASRSKNEYYDQDPIAQHQSHNGLITPNDGGSKARQLSPDGLRRLSLSPALSGRLSPVPHGPYNPALGRMSHHRQPSSPLREFLVRNKPSMLVALSQLFGASMNLSARLLELEGEGMHPMQLLLIRQSVTSLCSLLYMWWMKTPEFPFGKKEIRWLLMIRGMSGFFGVFGMWYSMMYLPLADATVITFLAPGVAGIICYFVLREPFTRAEQLATAVAFAGVVLIARPAALFAHSSANEAPANDAPEHGGTSLPGLDHETTAAERLVAVGVALTGVMGAAGAFTTLRAIGTRTHPLVSVNFFGMACTIICLVALIIAPLLDIGQPALNWTMPTSAKQWILLFILGIVGFVMQYLLTAGLSADKSNKANSMVYTHMLFAASFDRWVFGHHMGLMSFAGCALILGSAIGVALMKQSPVSRKDDIERQGSSVDEAEGSPMLMSVGGSVEDVNLSGMR